jgi:hypothetical protein
MTPQDFDQASKHGATVTNQGAHLTVQTAKRQIIPIAKPPTPETVKDVVTSHIRDAVHAVTGLHATIDSIENDPQFSADGRSKNLAAPRREAIRAIASRAAAVGSYVAEREGKVAAHYKVPELAESDVAGALRDHRIYDHYQRQSMSDRMRMLAKGDEKTLAALARSGVPFSPAEEKVIGEAWHAAVDRREPAKSAELKASLSNARWADEQIRGIGRFAARTSGLSPGEVAEAASGPGAYAFTDSYPAENAA